MKASLSEEHMKTSSPGGGVPVDKTARSVVAGGEHFMFRDKLHDVRSLTPLPTRNIPSHPEFMNLTGRRFGRLVVIGLADIPKSQKGARWVVRCACGWYEHRRDSFFRSGPHENQMCSQCDLLEERKKGLGPWSGNKQQKLEAKNRFHLAVMTVPRPTCGARAGQECKPQPPLGGVNRWHGRRVAARPKEVPW